MYSCMHCGTTVQSKQQKFPLKDFGPELVAVIKRVHDSLDIDHSLLCEGCFSKFMKQLSAQQLLNDLSRCCICNASLGSNTSHTLPSGTERDVLSAGIHPRKIPDDAVICINCLSYARLVARSSGKTSNHAEKLICIYCLQSLYRKPFSFLVDGPEKEYIKLKIAPRKVPNPSRICRSCSAKVKRGLQKHLSPLSEQKHNDSLSPKCDTNSDNLDSSSVFLYNVVKVELPSGPNSPESQSPDEQTQDADPLSSHTKTEMMQSKEEMITDDHPSTPQSTNGSYKSSQYPANLCKVEIGVSSCEENKSFGAEDQLSVSLPAMIGTSEDSSHENLPLLRSAKSVMKHFSCTLCIKPLRGVRSHPLKKGPVRSDIEATIFPRQIHYAARVCHTCWMAVSRKTHKAEAVEDGLTWELEHFKRTPDSAVSCFVPYCTNTERHVVPAHLKRRLLQEHKVFVTPNARVCKEHRSLQNWEGVEQLQLCKRFTKFQVEQMMLFAIEKNGRMPK